MVTLEDIQASLLRIESRLDKIEGRDGDSATGKGIIKNAGALARKMSPKEYILIKNPTDDLQRTLVLGAFLEMNGMESFTTEDLKQVFREARLKLPSNINDRVNKNLAKGYLMDADTKDGKKSWMLTMTGEKFINEGMASEEKS